MCIFVYIYIYVYIFTCMYMYIYAYIYIYIYIYLYTYMQLCTGAHVFELAHDDVHLGMMQKLLGPIPQVVYIRTHTFKL